MIKLIGFMVISAATMSIVDNLLNIELKRYPLWKQFVHKFVYVCIGGALVNFFF